MPGPALLNYITVKLVRLFYLFFFVTFLKKLQILQRNKKMFTNLVNFLITGVYKMVDLIYIYNLYDIQFPPSTFGTFR